MMIYLKKYGTLDKPMASNYFLNSRTTPKYNWNWEETVEIEITGKKGYQDQKAKVNWKWKLEEKS